MSVKNQEIIIEEILQYYPDVQAIYLFGSYGTEYERLDSDVDIALLLPPASAKTIKHLMISTCRFALEEKLHKEVDLINLRMVSTVFQKEVIFGGSIIYCQDPYARDEFEMLVLSYYQKLNEERAEILQSFYQTRRAYPV